MFVFPTSFSISGQISNCQRMYPGSVFKPMRSPLIFGQNSVNFTNVIFANGLFDPVRAYSPATSLSDSVIAINTENAAHALDIMFERPQDPPQIKATRLKERSIIEQWIRQNQHFMK